MLGAQDQAVDVAVAEPHGAVVGAARRPPWRGRCRGAVPSWLPAFPQVPNATNVPVCPGSTQDVTDSGRDVTRAVRAVRRRKQNVRIYAGRAGTWQRPALAVPGRHPNPDACFPLRGSGTRGAW
jgi:hypothetical protein